MASCTRCCWPDMHESQSLANDTHMRSGNGSSVSSCSIITSAEPSPPFGPLRSMYLPKPMRSWHKLGSIPLALNAQSFTS